MGLILELLSELKFPALMITKLGSLCIDKGQNTIIEVHEANEPRHPGHKGSSILDYWNSNPGIKNKIPCHETRSEPRTLHKPGYIYGSILVL